MKRIPQNIVVLVDQGIFSAGSLGMTIALARLLPADEFGRYGAWTLVAYLLASLLGAWWVQPAQVLQGRLGDRGSYLAWVAGLHGLSAIAVSVAGLTVSHVAGLAGHGLANWYWVAGFLMHDGCRKLLLAAGRSTYALMADLAMVLGQLVCLIGNWDGKWGLESMYWGLGTALVPALLIGGAGLGSRLRRLRWRIYLRQHMAQGPWLFVTAMLQWWSGNLYLVAGGALLGEAALGVMRLVQSLFGILNLLLQVMENHALPTVAQLLANDHQAGRIYLKRLTGWGFLAFGAVLVPMVVFAQPLLHVLGGPDYVAHAPVVQSMAFLYLLIAVSYPTRLAVRAWGLSRSFFMGYLVAFVVSLGLSSFVVREFGLMGIPLGMAVSQVVMWTIWNLELHRKQFYTWKSSTSYSARPTRNA